MENISKTLEEKRKTTVNSRDKYTFTVNSTTVSGKIDQFLEDLDVEPETLAKELARKLGNETYLPYFTVLAKNTNASRLFEALSITLDIARQGKIKKTKTQCFLGILNRWGMKIKFKK